MNKTILKVVAGLSVAAIVATSVPDVEAFAATSSVFPAAGGALAAGNGTSLSDIRAKAARDAAKKAVVSTHSKIKGVNSDKAAKAGSGVKTADGETKKTQAADAKSETVQESESVVVSGTVAGTSEENAGGEAVAAAEATSEAAVTTDDTKESAEVATSEIVVADKQVDVNSQEVKGDKKQEDKASEENADSAEDKTAASSDDGGETDEVIRKVETPSSKAVTESLVVNGTTVVGSASEAAKIEMTTSDGSIKSEGAVPASSGAEDGQATEPVDVSDAVIDVKPETSDIEGQDEELANTIIAQVDGYVYVRETPSEDAEYVGKLYNHSAGKWLGKEGEWYKIESGNVVGYVKGEYVVTGQAAVKLADEVGEHVAVVNTTTLKIREEANTDSTVLGLVPMEDKLTVLEEKDDWVKVSIEEGDGWVSKEFVSCSIDFPKAESKAEEEARIRAEEAARKKANEALAKATKKKSSGGSSAGGGVVYSGGGSGGGSSVASYACQFVGNPYVYGGTSLTNGTDCSGFTMSVYRNFGVALPHSSGAQRSCGYGVGSLAEAQPGDLICYSGHVAIYIGNGQIVHASTAATGIKISNAAYRQILAIRRIF